MIEVKKIQQNLTDILSLGTKEVERNFQEIKKRVKRMKMIQKRKDLFCELGRLVYEQSHSEEFKSKGLNFLANSDLGEMIEEIRALDADLEAQFTEESN